MRNLSQYPVTKLEIQQFLLDCVKQDESTPPDMIPCGSLDGAIVMILTNLVENYYCETRFKP